MKTATAARNLADAVDALSFKAGKVKAAAENLVKAREEQRQTQDNNYLWTVLWAALGLLATILIFVIVGR